MQHRFEIFSLTSVLDANHWANESAIPSCPSSFMFLHAFFYEDREYQATGVGKISLSPPQRALYRTPGFFPPGRCRFVSPVLYWSGDCYIVVCACESFA
jgi:hypothetical protein